jgi:glyceraldehyde 3-phosphate dehydrogenase
VPIRIGIDGLTSLNRQFLVAVLAGGFEDLFDVAAVTDEAGASSLAARLRFDPLYGRFRGSVEESGEAVSINGRSIDVARESEPKKIGWEKREIDLVVVDGSTPGAAERASSHVEHGARKAIVIGKGAGGDLTVVPGINEAAYDPDAHHRIATGSAGAQALAIMIDVLDQAFGSGRISYLLLYPLTSGRPAPAETADERAAAQAWHGLIPCRNQVQAEIDGVLPRLAGRAAGTVLGAPVAPVGWLSLTMETERRFDHDEVARAVTEAEQSDTLLGILGTIPAATMSNALAGDARSLVVDLSSLAARSRSMISAQGWFDAEWALACRGADLVALVCEAGIPGTA